MNRIADANQNFFQKHHKVLAALLAVALPYAGFNGYKEIERATAAPASSVEVTVTAPATSHEHPAPLTRADIATMIRLANRAQDKETAKVFKKLEPWERTAN